MRFSHEGCQEANQAGHLPCKAAEVQLEGTPPRGRVFDVGDAGRLVDSGQKTNKFRGFTRDVDVRQQTVLGALRREPSLLNPQVSNRFEFARSKAILVSTLGSQQAAIEVMKQDPSILQASDVLEDMSPGAIRGRAATASLFYQLRSNWLLLLALGTLVAVGADSLGYDIPQLEQAKRALDWVGAQL